MFEQPKGRATRHVENITIHRDIVGSRGAGNFRPTNHGRHCCTASGQVVAIKCRNAVAIPSTQVQDTRVAQCTSKNGDIGITIRSRNGTGNVLGGRRIGRNLVQVRLFNATDQALDGYKATPERYELLMEIDSSVAETPKLRRTQQTVLSLTMMMPFRAQLQCLPFGSQTTKLGKSTSTSR